MTNKPKWSKNRKLNIEQHELHSAYLECLKIPKRLQEDVNWRP